MGIDAACLDYLMHHRDKIKGRALQLGRQGAHFFNGDEFIYAQVVFRKHDKDSDILKVFEGAPHTENFFKYLGAEEVDSMDYSPFEGASIIHDLNDPVPEELENQFDFIFDGGTIEHVFDVKSTMQNIRKMLKVGGTFMSVNCANGHLGHGFYQFSPEFYRTVFSKQNGFNILSVKLAELHPIPIFHDLPDHPFGSRQLINTGVTPLYVCFAAEKVEEVPINRNLQQSDYLAQWGEVV